MGVTSSGLAVRGSIKSLGFVLFVTLVVIFISIGALLVRFETQKQEQIQRDQTMETLYTLRASLSSRIYMNIYRIPAVNSIIAMNTELTQEDFTRAIKVQFTEEHDFRNIAIARDMIVQFVYPLEGNETVVGLDYTTIPDQIESVEKAIQQNELVIAGPVALVQGGEGIIARNPIYVSNPVTGEDIFWGLSSSVLYADSLFNAAGIVPEVDGLLIAIRGKDALGPDGDVFMGDPSVFESSPLQQNIELPYGSWQIAAVPAGGWLAETIFFTPLLWAYYIGVVILLGFTALVIRLTITRQDAITALQDAENRLQKTAYELTENIPVGTYTMVQPPEGGLGKFAFLSRRFLELTGLRREDALVDPMKAFACSHPDDFDDWIALNAESFAEKKAFYGETRIIVNGEIRWVKAESRPRSLPDGSTVWEGVLTDITDQKQLEEQLIQEKENAEAANVAKSQFLANMSHEIRTPLNGLIGFTDLLKNTPLSAVQQQYVNNAHVSGHTLLSVISDILDFSKIEAGKLELESRKTNLPELLEDSIDVVRFHAEKKGLELLLYIGDTVPELVYTDSVRLKQVLANLLGNAVKFTERGEVELSVDGELLDENVARLRFTVRDTGIGITEAQRDRLFNAFSQADTSTTRRFGGTGLGLAISEMIVNKMGGKIDFTSRPGVETTFFFTLTLPVEATQDKFAKESRFSYDAVIIQEHAAARSILEKKLTRIGISYTSFGSTANAIEHLTLLQRADIIFCDHTNGPVNGPETVRLLRNQLKNQNEIPPIVMLHTSTVDEHFYEECDVLGVRCLLIKPVKQRHLTECLEKLSDGKFCGDPLSDSIDERSSTHNLGVKDASHTAESPESSSITRPLANHDSGVSLSVEAPDSKIDTDRIHELDTSKANASMPKILIAEDVYMNMLLLKAIIKNTCPEAIVFEAENGSKAVELFTELKPDLVFMDVHMPEMDGLQSTVTIRNIEAAQGKRTPIIALTAGTLKEEKDKCFEAGMDYFLAKPVEIDHIKEVLAEFKIL